jgi:hypothetical protein
MQKLNKLYNALVVGGSALAAGCAGNSASVAGPMTSTSKTPTVPTATESIPPKKASEDATAKSTTPDASKIDCSKVCDGQGRGAVCPDPSAGGSSNCCWLMAPPGHPCCQLGERPGAALPNR